MPKPGDSGKAGGSPFQRRKRAGSDVERKSGGATATPRAGTPTSQVAKGKGAKSNKGDGAKKSKKPPKTPPRSAASASSANRRNIRRPGIRGRQRVKLTIQKAKRAAQQLVGGSEEVRH